MRGCNINPPIIPFNIDVYWGEVPITYDIAFRPETITRETILTERNTELRRVMIERIGPERFAQIMQPALLDSDTDEAGNVRTLLRIDVHDRQYFGVRYECPSTGRQYLTPVPGDMTSCVQAVSKINGVDNDSELVMRT